MLADFVLDFFRVGCVVAYKIVEKEETVGVDTREEDADALRITADNLTEDLYAHLGVCGIEGEHKLAGSTLGKVFFGYKQQTAADAEITHLRKGITLFVHGQICGHIQADTAKPSFFHSFPPSLFLLLLDET